MNPVKSAGRIALGIALLGAVAWAAGCSRKPAEEEPAPGAATPAEPDKAAATGQPPQASAEPAEDRTAEAVVTSKTSAPVDLRYDLPAKPVPGQSFEIELAFKVRAAADTLEVEVTGMPGLLVETGTSHRYAAVVGGETYAARVSARADAPGLYYLGVVAKMITPVQTEARTFSIPVAVGAVVADEKPAPAQDGAGAPIQSMPAVETTQEAAHDAG